MPETHEATFDEVKDFIKADAKGRIVLGRSFSGRGFRVSKSAEGNILLTPVSLVPERDMWLYRNPQALAAFQQGLAEAAAGNVLPAEDLSRYADDEIGDE